MALWNRRSKDESSKSTAAVPSSTADTAGDSPTVLQLLAKPEPIRLETIGDKGLVTLIASAIVNPFGPTLNVLAVDGDPQPYRELPVIRLMLNPFAQEAEQVGLARIGTSWDLPATLPPFFSSIAGSCPTILLPSAMLDHRAAQTLCARFLEAFDDGLEVLEKVRRFPGDPWNRIQQDVDGLGDVLEDIERGKEKAGADRRLAPEEADELAAKLLDEESLKQELAALFYAWKGSIDFQSGSLATRALSLDEFARYFSLIAPSCRMPDLDEPGRSA